MARKMKGRRRDDSSSSDTSSRDEISPAAPSPIRRTSNSPAAASKAQRNTRKKEDKGIKQMLKELKKETSELRKQLETVKNDTKETRKELKKLTESQNKLRRQLVHFNGSSGDDSAAPRSTSNQVQLPRYRLEFTCEVKDEIEKGQSIETKNHGKTISVALYDDHGQIVETEPLASATVMLVIVKGELNEHGNQYNWSREDFKRNIILRPTQGNSATGDADQQIESIVSSCVFKLDRGVKSHTGATIVRNSSNKKVKLGVMVMEPTDERVLEGLSNPFFVRGHDRQRQNNPHCNSKRQKQVLSGCGYPGNVSMLTMQRPSCPILTQPGESISGLNPIAAPNTIMPSTEPILFSQEQAPMLQDQFLYSTMYGDSMAQATNCLTGDNPVSAEEVPAEEINVDPRADPSVVNLPSDQDVSLGQYCDCCGKVVWEGEPPQEWSIDWVPTSPSTDTEE